MKTSSFRYDTIFLYASLQSVGHVVEYFARHTRKLVVFIIMPRGHGMRNTVRLYQDGMLRHEREVPSSTNIFLYYSLWWYFHLRFFFSYFSRHERVVVLAGHPIAFMGMSIVKFFRNVTYAYWVGDYFPPVHWTLVLFEKLKKYYHDRVSITYYLSDRINELYNGRIVSEAGNRTVMWGIKPFTGVRKAPRKQYRVLFIGVIRPSQGIEDLLLFLKNSSHVQLSILGSCEADLYRKYLSIIHTYGIDDRVWFPNAFIDDEKLKKIAGDHHVGIALYERGLHTATHYTDPGKVKTYIELGLPVVMTDTSAIASFIRKYIAGEIVEDIVMVPEMLERIKKRYSLYQKGVYAFARFFAYEHYYRKVFESLEIRT